MSYTIKQTLVSIAAASGHKAEITVEATGSRGK